MTDKEKEILKYDNVPVKVAAKYLGVGEQFIRIQMQRDIISIGCVKTNHQGKHQYYISPAKLISYKTGKDYNEVKEEISFNVKYEQLIKLKELLDKDILDKEEFEQEKRKILNS